MAEVTLKIKVWDNFHYQDEPESYELEESWTDFDVAIRVCKEIVESSLKNCYTPGMNADELYSNYRSFGDDPSIVGAPGSNAPFSAWTYAKERCHGFVNENQARAR